MPTDPNAPLAPNVPRPPVRSGIAAVSHEVGDWIRRLTDNSMAEQAELEAYQAQGGLPGQIGRLADSVGSSFSAGLHGQPDPVIEGQRQALRAQTAPTAPAASEPADMGVAPDGIPNAIRAPEVEGLTAAPAAAALTRGLQRRAYLNHPSPAAGLEGQALREAAGYRDMTNEVGNSLGPRETRYFKGQAYTPALGGGGVSTFETPDSVREQLVRDADETRLVRSIEDPDNLGTVQRKADIERSSLEQLESHRSRLAKELESHRSGLIDGRSAQTVQRAMEQLDEIEAQELNLFRKDPRFVQLTPAQVEYAEARLRADQLRERAKLRFAALGGTDGISQYLRQQSPFPQ